MTETEYFHEVQLIERRALLRLFENYFEARKCSNLYFTPSTGYTSHDATFDSGGTKVFVEYKKRNISTGKWPDTFIEKTKFIELYNHHKNGHYTLFIVEYLDYFMMFDLEYEFMLYRPYRDHDHMFFRPIKATKNNFDYSYGAREKAIRSLKYFDATYILTYEYEPIDYKSFLHESR